MASVGNQVPPPPPTLARVSTVVGSASALEGTSVTFTFTRAAPYTGASSFNWVVASSGNTALDIAAPLSGTVIFPAGLVATQKVIVSTLARTGTQGSRTITMTLSNPVNCTLAALTATFTLQDAP
jgi:hypothetical protein